MPPIPAGGVRSRHFAAMAASATLGAGYRWLRPCPSRDRRGTPDERRYVQLDVFAGRPGDGNPLAVVLDGDGLDDATMQAIARWTRLPETTFVFPPTTADASYGLRIFSPRREVPFAGHPSVGTAHAVLEAGLAQPARRHAGAAGHRRPAAAARGRRWRDAHDRRAHAARAGDGNRERRRSAPAAMRCVDCRSARCRRR